MTRFEKENVGLIKELYDIDPECCLGLEDIPEECIEEYGVETPGLYFFDSNDRLLLEHEIRIDDIVYHEELGFVMRDGSPLPVVKD